ncbi:MAG: hypothetical protein HQM05_15335 [Magnetococcales bacterium]|nr:hypothetical protein [Magnetococcales bacterium]
MKKIEIEIDTVLEIICDECGHVMEHKEVRMQDDTRASIDVYPCKICKNVKQKKHAELETEVRELRKYRARMDWLHTGGADRDAEGYEWGVARVKFNAHGQPVSVLWTDSDHRDLDAEMERTKSQNKEVEG